VAPNSLSVPIALRCSSKLSLPSTPIPSSSRQKVYKKEEISFGNFRQTMSTPETEQDQHRIALKLLSEMELEKSTKRKNYSKTEYQKKKNLQNEWKRVYGVMVPIKKIRFNRDPETLIAQVLTQKRKKKKKQDVIQELDGKKDVYSRLCKGNVLIDC